MPLSPPRAARLRPRRGRASRRIPVATRMRAMGHEVYTPTLTGLGERSHLMGIRPTLPTFIEDVGNGLPATYVAVSNPYFPNTSSSRRFAREKAGWTYLEIPTTHDAMLLMPDEVAGMLADIG